MVQDSKVSIEYVDFYTKMSLNLDAPLGNKKTKRTLLLILITLMNPITKLKSWYDEITDEPAKWTLDMCQQLDIMYGSDGQTHDVEWSKWHIGVHYIVLSQHLRSTVSICWLVWWWLCNFMVRQVNFNSFLHPNEPPQRIFDIL